MRVWQRLGVGSTIVSTAIGLMCAIGPNAAKAETLVNEQGSLGTGDAVLDDGSLYDQFVFMGSSGQQITISLESQEFDPYLILLDPDGRRISENDDISRSNRNSQIRIVLPSTGDYIVVANSYESGKNGTYKIKVERGDYQSSTRQELAVAIPNGSPLCNSAIRNAVADLRTDRDIGVVVSTLLLNTLYEEILVNRPNGLNMAFSGPASESLISSPQILGDTTRELVRNCDTLGAVVFGSAETDIEKIFGYLPALAESSSQAGDVPVGEFSCAPTAEDPQAPLVNPGWGEQVCL